jgi:hypothetical protein
MLDESNGRIGSLGKTSIKRSKESWDGRRERSPDGIGNGGKINELGFPHRPASFEVWRTMKLTAIVSFGEDRRLNRHRQCTEPREAITTRKMSPGSATHAFAPDRIVIGLKFLERHNDPDCKWEPATDLIMDILL